MPTQSKLCYTVAVSLSYIVFFYIVDCTEILHVKLIEKGGFMIITESHNHHYMIKQHEIVLYCYQMAMFSHLHLGVEKN